MTGLIDGWACGDIEEDPIGLVILPTKDERNLCKDWNDWDEEDEEDEEDEDEDEDDKPVEPV